MKSFRNHLKESLKDEKFAKEYAAQRDFLQISLFVARLRNKKKMNQAELAKKAGVTQQQLSKIENGLNCNVTTLMKVINALDSQLKISEAKKQDNLINESIGWIKCELEQVTSKSFFRCHSGLSIDLNTNNEINIEGSNLNFNVNEKIFNIVLEKDEVKTKSINSLDEFLLSEYYYD